MVRQFLSLIIIAIVSAPVAALQDRSHDQIAKLEQQVKTLTTEVELLRAQNTALESQLAGIRGILKVGVEQDGTLAAPRPSESDFCFEQLAEIRETRNRLSSFGYKDSHPDMTNIISREKTVAEECDALVAAGT